MEMPKISEVKRFDESNVSEQDRRRAYAAANAGPQYASKGCSCSTFLGATTQHGCCYS